MVLLKPVSVDAYLMAKAILVANSSPMGTTGPGPMDVEAVTA